ncbi:SNF2 family N-terminal domain-containing protein [Calycina marina]|uniref:SNF2 family N-terminal domain-containing protein n=1 Tax=Calycina marina TaxID=1763456 RepID=A0A9P7Z328_9HELO|nr:SNF2 family N-terminal domain-containing protein [Calycina marina]
MSSSSTASEPSRLPESAPSSPPNRSTSVEPQREEFDTAEEKEMIEIERRAQIENGKAEDRRKKKLLKRRKGQSFTKEEKTAQAAELETLLKKTEVFSQALTKKTEVLGRVGSGFDGKALGEHDLEMAKQPTCMVGGTMRPYQLEGLTWMYEICIQGMSGILADEMGLGKTIQTISLIALLREKENYLGPHLIIAPVSTLSNWIEEFEKWTPDIPVLLYHGTPAKRKELLKSRLMKHIIKGRPDDQFPIICTSPEILMRDNTDLCKISWEFIIIDEGHRMKNCESKLFRMLKEFTSATRLLITGTPLQNDLKELWSLLNFLLPMIFTSWDQFESWFDFSDLQDEEGTEKFLEDKMKQDLIKKIHLILQPLLLRRIKADVEHMLPKKREYVLYAPMTREQTDLYNVISDKSSDTRKYLENKVIERLDATVKSAPATRKTEAQTEAQPKMKVVPKIEEPESSEDDVLLAIRTRKAESSTPKNAFQRMMQGKDPGSQKRKLLDDQLTPASKSLKSSRESTPGSIRSARSTSGRKFKGRKVYKESDASGEDELSDDEFEQKLADELVKQIADEPINDASPEELTRMKTLELAKKEISTKKLGNPLMQLRLICNSPHNFFNPWTIDSGLPVDETLVTSSGKMLLLDRLLPSLFERGHKVLIFSQFKTQLDILEDYARDLRKWEVCRIDGSVVQDDRRQQIKEFNTNKNFKLFLLSTRAGGQGINLASADTVILFDSDWNPQQDLQAQDRAHRIGQTRPVVIFRLATKDTVEEELLMSADAKRRLEKLVIKKGGFKTMGQKFDKEEAISKEALKALLLKDGEIFKISGGDNILTEDDLNILCDRSDAAYARAEKGLGNAAGFKIVETKLGGLMATKEN